MIRRLVSLSIGCLLSACVSLRPMAARSSENVARETLPAEDGWASFEPGTQGGSAAAPERVYHASTRRALINALSDGPKATPSSAPKLIFVEGVIDFNVDDDNHPLDCERYARLGFTRDAYLSAYSPQAWGRNAPAGKEEEARRASQQAQAERIRVRVGSNTTLFGSNAVLKGISLEIVNADNVIVRNIEFIDTYDCFPSWDPNDGAQGAWNSEYDSISVRNSHHVWIDHNSFADVDTVDDRQPSYFGRHFQIHDGQLDITEAADLVTVSWNRFADHDKTMLIGSSDSAFKDRDRLRVTLHHNEFDGIIQRTPRVRFGRVHVYNNVFRAQQNYQYSLAAGFESHLYAESNVFELQEGMAPTRVLRAMKGASIVLKNNRVNDTAVDLLAEFNKANVTGLVEDPTWHPTLHLAVDDVTVVRRRVRELAGATLKPR